MEETLTWFDERGIWKQFQTLPQDASHAKPKLIPGRTPANRRKSRKQPEAHQRMIMHAKTAQPR